ncbi:MAG TPA: hypothetical protein VIL95_07940, partial [Bacillota bacterium]
YAPFYLYPLLAWPVAAGLWWCFRHHRRPAATSSSPLRLWRRIRTHRPSRWLPWLWTGFFATHLLSAAVVLWSEQVHARLGPWRLGLATTCPLLALSLSSWASCRFWGDGPTAARRLFWAGHGLMIAGLLLFGFLPREALQLGGVTVAGIGVGILLPRVGSALADLVGPADRGLVLALYGSTRFAGGAVLIPLLTAAAAAIGRGPIMLMAALLPLAGLWLERAPSRPAKGPHRRTGN